MLEDVFAEIRAVETWQRHRERADGVAARFGPDQAALAQLTAQIYPGIRPGALLAVVQGGYRPDHPVVAQIAELSERLNLTEHPGGADWGQPAVGPAMRGAAGEARREANRVRNIEDAALPPRWVGADPAAIRLYQQAEAAGIVTEGMFRDGTDMNVNSPQFYAWRDTLNKFSDMGVRVPLVNPEMTQVSETSPQAPDPDATPGTYRAGLRFGYERVAGLRPFTDEWRDAYGIGDRSPSFTEQAARVMGEEAPSGPQAAQVAGLAEDLTTMLPRSGFVLMDAPVQEIQGQVRNIYAATHGRNVDWLEPQSDLGVILSTRGLDLQSAGSGFFVDPESEVATERRRREAERGQIGGHNVTLGRWAIDALTPFDPNTKPYMVASGLVDFGVQLADPSAWGLGKAGEASRAARLFEAAGDDAVGGVRGLRWLLRPQNASHWLDRNPDVLAAIAAERSPYNIWRASNRKLPIDLATRLADEGTDPAAVRAILEPELGRRVREVATVDVLPRTLAPGGGLEGSGLRRGNPLSVMPARGRIDAHDPDIVAWEVEATLRNAHATDATIREAVDRVARADTPIKLNAAVRRAIDDDLDGILKLSGVEDDEVRRTVTRLHADAHEETSRTFVEATTFQGATDNPLMVAGESQWYPGAHLINEHAPRWLTMPEPRAVRRLTTELPNIFGRNIFAHADGSARLPAALLDAGLNRVWKPLQLVRMAWTARVIGEEQVRMAAAGYDSMFNHPLSFIAWRTGRRGNIDAVGDVIDEANAWKVAMTQRHGGWVDRAVVPTGIPTTYHKGDVGRRGRFNEAWGSELIRLSADPVAQKVANADTLDDAYEWFTRGGGNKFRGDLAAAHPGRFDTDEAARAYIDTVKRRIDHATGGDTDLYEAVRTGRFDGTDMLAGTGMDSSLPGKLDGYYDQFAPDTMIGVETRTLPRKDDIFARWDSAVDRLFGFLMTNRTNNLSRSPTFKQAYWKEVNRLMGTASADARATILANAEQAGLSGRTMRGLGRNVRPGAASAVEIDTWAKAHALDQTKNLLYDMTQRGRFMDAARLVFPFGEAWSEVITRWFGKGGLVRSNPKTVRRFQQMAQGARGEDFGDVMGAPEGEGFFWRNEFDEEVFVIPGSRFLTDATLGVPVPMVGSVKGLSMFGSVIPGIGPAVQIPAGWIMANKPGPQWLKSALGTLETTQVPLTDESVRDTITPFGSIGTSDQSDVLDVRNYLPTWMRTAVDFVTDGDGNESQYGTAVKSVMAYLYSTGNYGNSREELARLQEDATDKARWLTLIRALGQGISPSSPSPDYLVVDKDDRTVRLRAMAEEYRKLQQDDYDTADDRFLEAHGQLLLGAVQSQSAGIEYAVPTSREGARWVLDNPGIEAALPHLYGFFAPQGGEFDYSLYSEQFANGDRAQLDPGTFARLMANTTANTYYQAAIDQVGEDRYTDNGRAYLNEVKQWIWDRYPTWGDSSRMGDRPELDVMVREAYHAAGNKAAAGTDAGEGLRLYIEARDQVIAAEGDEAVRADGTLSGAEWMSGAHTYLTDVAAWITERHPDFAALFDMVFSRELSQVEED